MRSIEILRSGGGGGGGGGGGVIPNLNFKKESMKVKWQFPWRVWRKAFVD